MASLATRISDFITAMGSDIKYLRQTRFNQSIANQTGFAADTYLTGSNVVIPQGKVRAGTRYRCRFDGVKTAAGVAAPIINVRVGTAASTADTARATLTFAAQTAVIDEGTFEVDVIFRAAGATAVIQAMGQLWHRLVTTGLNVTAVFTKVLNTGAAFDVTGANLQIGLSVNGGTSAAWTVSMVRAEIENISA